ncbi:MAG: hypothetical protein M4579_004631 [Chaenotheca gracillima]|nr:MAG: hypothetical protein M4579_004631 [Chaenotheca gracillima]
MGTSEASGDNARALRSTLRSPEERPTMEAEGLVGLGDERRQTIQATTQLGDLPNELLDEIYQYLSIDGPPPSWAYFSKGPALNRPMKRQPLKHLSCVSRLWRYRTLPWLFNHCFLNIDFELSEASKAQEERCANIVMFTDFLFRHRLQSTVESIVLFSRQNLFARAPSRHSEAFLEETDLRLLWSQLCCIVSPAQLIIVAPPATLAHLLEKTIPMEDEWAFDIPLQAVSLKRPTSPPDALSAQKKRGLHTDPILAAHPWTHLSLMEGSALPAYHTYEYFLKETPSLLHSLSVFGPRKALLDSLASLRYTAFFPFYNHVDLLLSLARHCPRLREFRIQIAPCEAEMDVMQHQMRQLDPRDLWMEADTSYSLILHAVREMGLHGSLQEFVSEDCVWMNNLYEVEKTFAAVLIGWNRRERGIWSKGEIDAGDETSGETFS